MSSLYKPFLGEDSRLSIRKSADVKKDPHLTHLCISCRSLINEMARPLIELEQETPLKGNTSARSPNFGDMKTFQEDSCGMCIASMEGLTTWNGIYLLPSSDPESMKAKLGRQYWNYQLNLVGYNSVEGKEKIIEFTRYVGNSNGVDYRSKAWIAKRESMCDVWLDVSTGSKQSLSFAQQALKKCTEKHYDCQKPGPFLPTRLIELSDDGCRLRTNLKGVPNYTTLSYCWGSVPPFKLTMSNTKSLHDEIFCKGLPKTFQDAIYLTRSLGFKYLWIDALCIIQDDVDDWRRESSLMGEIYGNSTLNIAATHGKNASEGLFVDRDTSRKRNYFSTPGGALWEIFSERFYEEAFSSAPLSKRAWAFQEVFLSPRTLHFSAKEVFWECREHMSCETFPEAFPTWLFRHSMHMSERVGKLILRTNLSAKWPEIVHDYSKRQITYSSDKLVALAGVARRLQKTFKCEHLAGLWETDFVQQLCWAVAPQDGYLKPKVATYQAPSWSWASTNQPVSWSLYNLKFATSLDRWSEREEIVKLTNFTINPIGEDSFGQLKDAEVQLKCGPLIRASDALPPFKLVHTVKKESSWFSFSEWLPSLGWGSNDGTPWYNARVFYDNEEATKESEIQYLPVEIVFKDNISIKGIVLTRNATRGKGYFSRIGVFLFLSRWKSYGKLMEELALKDALLTDDSWYQQILKPDTNGVQQNLISLV